MLRARLRAQFQDSLIVGAIARGAQRAATPFRVLQLSRPPISVQARTQFDRYGKAQVQGVRFRPRPFRLFDLLSIMLTGGVVYLNWNFFVLQPLDKLAGEVDAVVADLPDEEKKKLDEEMAQASFIPFPLTTQLIQPGPYFRNSPEIIEYQKLQKDPATLKQLVADAAPWAAQQIPEHGYAFVALKPKPYRQWIDVKFQDLPPPYYTQSGLEIGDDFIAWATNVPTEADVAQRLQRVIYPLPVAKAMWNYIRVAFTLGDANEKAGVVLTENLKLPTGYKVTFDQLVANTPSGKEQAKKQREAARKKATDMAMRIAGEQENMIEKKLKTSADGSVSQQSSDTSLVPSFDRSENNGQTSEKQQPTTLLELARKKKEGPWSPEDDEIARQYILSLPGVNSYMQVAKRLKYATAVFLLTFQREQKPMICPPPPGAVKVSGLMQMLVPNGWMLFDVEMHWDPKTKAFDEHSFKADLVKAHVSPRGVKQISGGVQPGVTTPTH